MLLISELYTCDILYAYYNASSIGTVLHAFPKSIGHAPIQTHFLSGIGIENSIPTQFPKVSFSYKQMLNYLLRNFMYSPWKIQIAHIYITCYKII